MVEAFDVVKFYTEDGTEYDTYDEALKAEIKEKLQNYFYNLYKGTWDEEIDYIETANYVLNNKEDLLNILTME